MNQERKIFCLEYKLNIYIVVLLHSGRRMDLVEDSSACPDSSPLPDSSSSI